MAQTKLVVVFSGVLVVLMILFLEIQSIEGSRHFGKTDLNLNHPQLTKIIMNNNGESRQVGHSPGIGQPLINSVGNDEGVISTAQVVPSSGGGALGQSRSGLHYFKPSDPGHSPGIGQSIEN